VLYKGQLERDKEITLWSRTVQQRRFTCPVQSYVVMLWRIIWSISHTYIINNTWSSCTFR